MKLRAWVAFAGLGALTAVIWFRIRKDDAQAYRASSSHKEVAAPLPGRPSEPAQPWADRRGGNGSSSDRDDKGDVIGSTAPTSKEYDPITIVQATHAAASDLLKKEPRVAAFADRREDLLQAHIAARLRKRLSFDTKVDTKCRASSCELTVQGARNVGDMNAVIEAIEPSSLAEAAQIGTLADPSDPEARAIQITLLYSAALRDHAAYEQWLRQHPPHDHDR